MVKPEKPIVPAAPLRSDPATFAPKAEQSLLFLPIFAQYLNDMADFIDQRVTDTGAGLSTTEVNDLITAGVQSFARANSVIKIPGDKLSDRAITTSKISNAIIDGFSTGSLSPSDFLWISDSSATGNKNRKATIASLLALVPASSGDDLTQAQVTALMQTWARAGSSAKIPSTKLTLSTLAQALSGSSLTALMTPARTKSLANSLIVNWAKVGNGTAIPADKLDNAPRDTAAQILEKLKTVDENNSGLNAQFLQGHAFSEFFINNGSTASLDRRPNEGGLFDYTSSADGQPSSDQSGGVLFSDRIGSYASKQIIFTNNGNIFFRNGTGYSSFGDWVQFTGDITAAGVAALIATETTAREEVDTALGDRISGKQDTLSAGDNITITDGTIAASGTGGSDTAAQILAKIKGITDIGSVPNIVDGINATTLGGVSSAGFVFASLMVPNLDFISHPTIFYYPANAQNRPSDFDGIGLSVGPTLAGAGSQLQATDAAQVVFPSNGAVYIRHREETGAEWGVWNNLFDGSLTEDDVREELLEPWATRGDDTAIPASKLGNAPRGPDFSIRVSVPSNGGQLSATHGLGGPPTQVWAYLECIEADHGYAVGDRIAIGTEHRTGTLGIQLHSNAANIFVTIQSAGYEILSNTTPRALFNITAMDTTRAKWKIQLLANR